MNSRRIIENTENKLLELIQYEGDDQGHEWPVRLFLWFLKRFSSVYKAIVQLRIRLYDSGMFRRVPMGCQIISIGNVTVGGTGKTPMVEKLAKELSAQGRKVAILSRGYRKKEKTFFQKLHSRLENPITELPPRVVSDGEKLLLDCEMSGDEPYMLAVNLPNVIVLVDKDRVKSARYAIRQFKCDTLLLDDGFQYQKLQHRLDLVLVDRSNPFGNGNVLPRGILREPVKNLKRAQFICITKARHGDTEALKQAIRKLNSNAYIMECNHEPCALLAAFSREQHPLKKLNNMKIVALSGIASPQSFEKSLENLGANIISRARFADHHRFSQQELLDIVNSAKELEADAIITTEKDAVRMIRLDRCDVPIYFVRIELRFISGEEEFKKCIGQITFTNQQ